MESFLIAKECLHYLNKNKIPAVLYKVDFAKAFDSVSWCFLTNLLVERGFPPRWISWVLNILKSSSSTVKVNGVHSNSFIHYRGLRQGDPLSPMLFILVADALQQFLSNANHLFSGAVILAPKALQFADDTAIIMEAHPKNLILVNRILKFYAALTGLTINASKSTFVAVALRQELVPVVEHLLQCKYKSLPITYLGIPLSVRRPRKVHFQPLLNSFHKKLQGWKAKFLSLAGRLTLVKSVLTAMPLHLMQVLKLPQGIVQSIDKIRRNFLWKHDKKCLGGHCLVNWSKCCLPKQNGGLGILNLTIQNDALLAKWVWLLMAQPNSNWSKTIRGLYGTSDISQLAAHPLISNQLADILNTRSFMQVVVSSLPDGSVLWNLSKEGQFSVSSAYRFMAHSGIISSYHRKLWKIKAPPKVKTFIWLLLQDRLLTQANLILRGWPAQASCVLCATLLEEDLVHLFLTCQFTLTVWQTVGILFDLTLDLSALHPLQFWLHNRNNCATVDKKRLWDLAWSATCWTLWKIRCSVIFRNTEPTVHQALIQVELLIRNWSFSLCRQDA